MTDNTPETPETKTYIVLRDGWVAGRRVVKNEKVELTEAAARYEPVEPFGHAAPKPAAARKPKADS